MRKLTELIVLVRGGGETGSAIAHKLYRSHFRVCIAEVASPLDINRGVCFSEAVYDTAKVIEDVSAERTLVSLEQIYKIWRNDKIPVVVDPDLTVKPLLKPDVLVNAMMLNRQTSTRMTDAPLVIGIGRGFFIGNDAHLVIESGNNKVGQVLIEGEAVNPVKPDENKESNLVLAEDAGVFNTDKNIGDTVLSGDSIGRLNEAAVTAPTSGVLRGILRNEARVLANVALAEIDPVNDKSTCFCIRNQMRSIAGGVMEAIMMSLNVEELG